MYRLTRLWTHRTPIQQSIITILAFAATVVILITVFQSYRWIISRVDAVQDRLLPGIGSYLPDPIANRLSSAKTQLLVDEMQLRDSCDSDGYCALLHLGGRVTAATWLDDDRVYIANRDGTLSLLNVVTGEIGIVATGLSLPQGLEVLNNRLFVSHMGDVCEYIIRTRSEGEGNGCRPYKRQYDDIVDILRHARGQVLSFSVDSAGNLEDRQVVLGDIPTVELDHSANGIASNGRELFVSIGHPEETLRGSIHQHIAQLQAEGVRTDLMGTIVRIDPRSNKVEIYATGLRNTYQISIGPDGTIWGADNDSGSAALQAEELNAIVEGGYYGFPEFGTYENSPEQTVIGPVAVLEGKGSTVAYANREGIYVAYLLQGEDGGPGVDRFDYETMSSVRIFRKGRNYITAILERNSLLYLFTHSGYLHVVDPDYAPITSR